MNYPRQFRDYLGQLPAPARWMLLGIVTALSLLGLYVASALLSWFVDGSRQLQALEPRIARLYGYAASVDTLRDAIEQQRSEFERLMLPAGSDIGNAGAQLQQQLRGYAESAELKVVSSQLLAPRLHEGFEEIRIDLDTRGPLEGVDALLAQLQKARPLLLTRTLELSAAPTRRGDNSQTALLSLSVSALKLP